MTSNDWLYRLFNSKSFSDWIAVYYLNIYRFPGLQYYLLQKIAPSSLPRLMPQLTHILFSSESPVILHYLLTQVDGNPSLCMKLWFCARVYGNNKALMRLIKNCIKDSLLRHRNSINGSRKGAVKGYGYRGVQDSVRGALLQIISAAAFFNKDVYNYASSFKSYNVKAQQEDPDIRFVDELVGVSERLRVISKPLRKKAFLIEMKYLNRMLRKVNNIPLVGFSSKGFMINAEKSRLLDSASNVPFMLSFSQWDGSIPPKPTEIEIMWMQLYAVEPSVDINKIRERLIKELSKKTKSEANDTISSEEVFISKSKVENTQNQLIVPYKYYEGFYAEVIRRTEGKNSIDDELSELVENIKINNKQEKHNDYLIIFKSGDDMRMEFVASQVLAEIQAIWDEQSCKAKVHPYQIYLITRNSGFIEVVRNAPSIHEIKKTHANLKSYYEHCYGNQGTEKYTEAKTNFLCSLVGYSIATYLLQLKDRHNGNILIDSQGSIVHVDFGFVFGKHPGIYNVEYAPFKFAIEYLDLVSIAEFKGLFVEAFMILRRHSERLCRLVEIFDSKSDVFPAYAVNSFRQRFRHDLAQIEPFLEGLVDRSIGAVTTRLYDSFQYYSQGYYQ